MGTPLRVRRGRGVLLGTFSEKPFRFVFSAHESLYINYLFGQIAKWGYVGAFRLGGDLSDKHSRFVQARPVTLGKLEN